VIVIRSCKGQDELEACVQLQVETWGYDPTDVIPRKAFLVWQKVGGQVIGAFDNAVPGTPEEGSPESMVGFVLALPGIKPGNGGPSLYLHSHMMGVQPPYRNLGVGRMLKLAQREEALARNIRLIEWTFDPLELKNAYFNIERLGAVVRRYVLNQYGTTTSHLHGGLPTDRCIAEWYLDSERVLDVLAGKPVPHTETLERVAVPSNAEGARRARDERGSAAIASRAAADIYGLTVLANEIEDRPDNTTRSPFTSWPRATSRNAAL